MSNACGGCGEEALLLPVRVCERIVGLCCDCRRHLDRADRTPEVRVARVESIPPTRHVTCDGEGGVLDTVSYLHQRGVR